MKNIFFVFVISLMFLPASAQGLQRDGKIILDHHGNEILLRGLGLGGWMLMEGYMMHSSDVADTQHEFRSKLEDLIGIENTDTFFNHWLDNHVTRKDIDSMASWGYNSVRLPMHYNLFTLPIEDEPVSGQNTWLDKGFQIVDSLLSWCADNQIYLILDLHAAPGGQGRNAAICDYDPNKPSLWESEENRDKTVALWKKLAERYHDENWIGGYDLLNEVNWDLPGNTMLRSLYEEITTAIRSVDTTHIIFIEGNGFANDFTGLTPPWDENMAYSFHKYWNFNDPGSIQWVLNIRDQYNIPLWMGEGGENSNVWFTDAIKLFEEKNIGWSFWPMKRIETIVSPYSIEYSQGYRDILAYWRNEGPEPSVEYAFNSMMELAENTNSTNCLYRKDVHDAQLRQTISDDIIPYSVNQAPGLIYASEFDLGKLNFAYYDTDHVNYSMSVGEFNAWNSGWHFRNDGVDIEPNSEPIRSNGYHVGFVKKGEWMNYTLNISLSGTYTAIVRVASEQNGGIFHLELDNESITSLQTVSASSGWTSFYDIIIEDVILSEGTHHLKFSIDSDKPFNICSMELVYTSPATEVEAVVLYAETVQDERSVEVTCNHSILGSSLAGSINSFSLRVNGLSTGISNINMATGKERSFILETDAILLHTDEIIIDYVGNQLLTEDGVPFTSVSNLPVMNTLPGRFILPWKIQAEDFSHMIGFGLEQTTDIGGGFNLGYADAGDYADYMIHCREENNFIMNMRVASKYSTGSFGFYLLLEDSTELELFTVDVPSTGGWQTWNTISEEIVIPEGNHIIRLKALSGEFNLNWFSFEIENSVPSIDQGFSPIIYPNPNRLGILNIRLEEQSGNIWQADLFSLDGKLLLTEMIYSDSSTAVINISTVPSGIYTLQLSNNLHTHTCKVIRL